MENDDSEKFNALCFLAGVEPEMCDELSTYSFGITVGGAPSALGKYAAYCRPVDTSMGGFHVGGAADGGVPSFATVKIDGRGAWNRSRFSMSEELHLQHAWMIDDDGDDNNELLNDSESDEEIDLETVSDARRPVVPRHVFVRDQESLLNFETDLLGEGEVGSNF
ncbi:hypothetical protein CYMTET_15097 [Cymbomonas tetramitiformis]|uniref:Uncharacterized protein n=1 Tax=Cymbomonas tetramitiformis TaxID=36881 RepID=A0AAE0GF19_9CHLO|nr:hypothetical protein CYMTET_15097 [Cymbomonas tetramitiformis]